MKSLLCVVSLVACVCLADGELTGDKAEHDIVVVLRQKMADLKQRQEMELSETVAALEEEMKLQEERYKDKIIQLKDYIKALKVDRKVDNVMFSAYLTGGTHELGPGTIIPFDQVDLNVGDSFDNDTHTFVCPRNGMYFFTFSLQIDYRDNGGRTYWLAGTLTVSGKVVCSAASFYGGVDFPYHQHSSASVIALCNAGDEVLVKSSTAGVVVYGDSYSKPTSFTGFLLASL